MRLFFWITLLAATFQQVPTGTIEGTVVRAGTRIPIPGVHIKVQGNVAPGRPSTPFLAEVTTDGAGYFIIRDVPGGFGGTIEATREGYVGRASGARPVTTSVTVYPEQRVQMTNLELIPAATVRGRVIDSADRPMPGLTVDLVRLTTDDRGRRLWTRDNPLGKTNDQGVFQWSTLLPGEYYLRAIWGVAGAPGVAIYFPGTREANAAAPIVIREGDDFIADIRIPFIDSATFKVSGRVLHSLSRTPNSPAIGLTLAERNPIAPAESDPQPYSSARTVMDEATGQFELRGIPSGSYDLAVSAAVATSSYPAGKGYYLSKVPIEVRDQDVEGVTVVLRPGVDVKGKLLVDGDPDQFYFARAPGTVREPRRRNSVAVDVKLTRKDLSATPRPTSVAVGQGTAVTFPNVPEGDYEVSVSFEPQPPLFSRDPEFYLEDVRLAGRSVFDNGIRVGTDPVDSLEIVIGTHGGSIAGTIPGKGNASAQLILIPESFRRNNPALYRRVLVLPRNASGEFLMRGLAPGNYKLFALPEANDPFRSPEFVARYEHLAVTVAVQKGLSVGPVQVPFLTTVR